MRVIAGRYRGRVLSSPRGRDTRPTSDRVKEALFSILRGRVGGARVLDLFAGSGALGIEALSRDASHVIFIENARDSLAALERNLETIGLRENATVNRGDVFREVARLGRAGEKFDLVLADPPYRTGAAERVLGAVTRAGILAEGGLFVLERDRREPLPAPEGLAVREPRRYGDTVLEFYELRPVVRTSPGESVPEGETR